MVTPLSPPLRRPVTSYWPSGVRMRLRRKADNREDLEDARRQREKSDKLRDQARALARDLHRIREENHFADALKTLIEDKR